MGKMHTQPARDVGRQCGDDELVECVERQGIAYGREWLSIAELTPSVEAFGAKLRECLPQA